MKNTRALAYLFAVLILGSCAHTHDHAVVDLPAAVQTTVKSESSIYLSDSIWTNQHGEKIAFKKLAETPRLMSMVFTSCPSACPLLISDMKRVQSGLSADRRKQVRFTVFSIDSKNDTPQRLRAFHKKMHLDAQWDLFVSDAGSTTEVAALLGIQFKELPSGDFVHSNRLVALDARGETLGEKNGLGGSVDELIKVLK
jgi:protein SCO1/2